MRTRLAVAMSAALLVLSGAGPLAADDLVPSGTLTIEQVTDRLHRQRQPGRRHARRRWAEI
ncbi:MAG: hypothetical protein HC869_12010 [Rhodospirillales bacterium]|nr:hypothetical protein [Rhodospirillales bacterium]